MKYLARAAQRLVPAAAPAPVMLPAMASRSPVAEADQRLNIDAFAAHFEFPQAAPAQAQAHPPPQLRARPSVIPGPEMQRPVPTRAEAPAAAQAQKPATDPARVKQQITRKRVESVVERSSPPPPPSAARLTSPPRPVNVTPDQPRAEKRPQRPESAPAAPMERVIQTSLREPPSTTVIEAVTRAMSWVEAGTTSAPQPEMPAQTRQPSRPRSREARRTRESRTLVQDVQPVTHLEIGKIEVEVVQPEKPVRRAAPSPPAPKTSTRNFGWRQR